MSESQTNGVNFPYPDSDVPRNRGSQADLSGQLFRDADQQNATGVLSGDVVEMNKSVSFS